MHAIEVNGYVMVGSHVHMGLMKKTVLSPTVKDFGAQLMNAYSTVRSVMVILIVLMDQMKKNVKTLSVLMTTLSVRMKTRVIKVHGYVMVGILVQMGQMKKIVLLLIVKDFGVTAMNASSTVRSVMVTKIALMDLTRKIVKTMFALMASLNARMKMHVIKVLGYVMVGIHVQMGQTKKIVLSLTVKDFGAQQAMNVSSKVRSVMAR